MITGNVMKINTHDPKEWLSLKEVAYLLRVSRNTVSRLCQEIDPATQETFLHSWRPCPKLLMISRASFQRYCAATQADMRHVADAEAKAFGLAKSLAEGLEIATHADRGAQP